MRMLTFTSGTWRKVEWTKSVNRRLISPCAVRGRPTMDRSKYEDRINAYRHTTKGISSHFMMTSSNENKLRVTGPLCGEFTSHGWIPLKNTSCAVFWCFFICAWTNGRINNQVGGDLRRHRAHYDVTVKWFLTINTNFEAIKKSYRIFRFVLILTATSHITVQRETVKYFMCPLAKDTLCCQVMAWFCRILENIESIITRLYSHRTRGVIITSVLRQNDVLT